MTPVLLALVLGAADGGLEAPFADPLYSTCPEAPPVVELDGGAVLLPAMRAARVACLMETCDDARRRGKTVAETPPWWWVFASGALVVGLVGGYLIPKGW